MRSTASSASSTAWYVGSRRTFPACPLRPCLCLRAPASRPCIWATTGPASCLRRSRPFFGGDMRRQAQSWWLWLRPATGCWSGWAPLPWPSSSSETMGHRRAPTRWRITGPSYSSASPWLPCERARLTTSRATCWRRPASAANYRSCCRTLATAGCMERQQTPSSLPSSDKHAATRRRASGASG